MRSCDAEYSAYPVPTAITAIATIPGPDLKNPGELPAGDV